MEEIMHILLHSLKDTLNLVPFLFLTYLVIEFIEHKADHLAEVLTSHSRKLGPLWGGVLGVIPQCGFSAGASNLYAQGLITGGTVLAVFLSTSDEMLPILISESVPPLTIVKILLIKLFSGVASGLIFDRIVRKSREVSPHEAIGHLCEDENCGCHHRGILLSALIHTLSITLFIYLVTVGLNLIIHTLGEDSLGDLVLNLPVIGPLLSALVGLIPNCAASVVITKLYLSSAMSGGAMLAGLLAASGVGVLVLFRANRGRLKDNLTILAALYGSSVIIGIVFDLLFKRL